MKQKIKKFALGAVLVYVGVLVALYALQRNMIYFPDTATPDAAPYVGLNVAPVTVNTADGLALTGWYRAANAGQPTLVFFHGNAGHYGHRIHNAGDYIAQGYGVLLAGYRGYGGNEGAPSEQGFYHDARAYINFLKSQKVTEQDIILYGQSIGTGVAVQMATEFMAVRALILEAPYTALPDIAARQYPFIPVRLLMKDRFDNLTKMSAVKAPVLILHGEKDTLIPVSMGKILFNQAQGEKDIYILDGHGHNDMPFKVLSAYVIDFIKREEGA